MRKIQVGFLDFSQAQFLLKLRRIAKVDIVSTEKARGKGASQAPFKTQPKGENLCLVASCRGAEIFLFLGWQEGVQDFLSDVPISWAIKKFPCVERNNEINRVFRRTWSAEFLAELKQKRKGNRRGERSSVCRAKLRRYLKQKRKCKAELAALNVVERGKKTAS